MDIPDELIRLERTAEEERARMAGLAGPEYEEQWQVWRAASVAVQAAITEHAAETKADRNELEQAVKKAVRDADEDPAE
ncbi:hypothetical protein ACFV0T_28395 [Streptomyces sp. NPDC059582]|uniref:hypothetical protein n=1 Tax=Streptomyces sp. NPDC059582 TaxID=3346875 RepID=UPI0036BED3AF